VEHLKENVGIAIFILPALLPLLKAGLKIIEESSLNPISSWKAF